MTDRQGAAVHRGESGGGRGGVVAAQLRLSLAAGAGFIRREPGWFAERIADLAELDLQGNFDFASVVRGQRVLDRKDAIGPCGGSVEGRDRGELTQQVAMLLGRGFDIQRDDLLRWLRSAVSSVQCGC